MSSRQGMLFDLQHGRWVRPEEMVPEPAAQQPVVRGGQVLPASLQKLLETAWHEPKSTAPPWRLAKGSRSVNLPDGGKIRMENYDGPIQANMRLTSTAPSLLNASAEALYQFAIIQNPTRDTKWVMAILIEQIAFAIDKEELGRKAAKAIKVGRPSDYEEGKR